MSNISVSQVNTKKEMRAFVRFNYELYKDCPYAVPNFLEDTPESLDSECHPAFRFFEAAFFLARKDDRIVGRVVAIINTRANERWNKQEVRFGWIDFIDDPEVSSALFDAVAAWGKERGMNRMVGPLGFTDLDLEGMLIDGFDQLSTVFTIYNYPYYPQHLAKLGFEKEAVWLQRKVFVPTGEHVANNSKYFRIAQMVQQRYGFRLRHFKNKSEIKKGGYIHKLLGVINRSYTDLYGFSQLDDKQIEWYASKFMTIIDIRFLSVVENKDGEIIGVGICIPSLSTAVQKAKGKLFPFGWWHFLREIYLKRKHKILDMLLIGVVPEYQEKGANALFFADIIPLCVSGGFEWAEAHPQLEDNIAGQMLWKNLDCCIHKRRAVFAKEI